MNSSTNPPMTKSQKFKFDVDFDLEEERLRVEAEKREEEQRRAAVKMEEATKAVTYSEEEMTREKEAAYQKGLMDGEARAKQSLEHAISELVDRVAGKLRFLLEKEEERDRLLKETALTTTLAAIKKIWPQVTMNLGQTLVEDTIRQSLELNPLETRIVVRVHDSMLDAVVERLPQLKDSQAFAGKIIVLADDTVAAGDCKVEWADGGLERLSRTLSQQLDDAMTRVISRLMVPQPKDASSDTERMST
jgi:flagellar assembly protein FliH